MSEPKYVKLTGKSGSVGGFSQAWLGADHILIVNSVRLREKYQRFFFSDIQAIIISDSPNRSLIQALAAVVSLAWFLWAFETSSAFARGFFWITGAIAMGLVIRDFLRGARCRCTIQTAVSRERIRAISRMGTARRFLERVTPLIEAAQENLPIVESEDPQAPEEARIISDPNISETDVVDVFPAAEAVPTAQPPQLRKYIGYGAEVFFGVLMVTALLIFVGLRSTFNISIGLLPMVYMAEFAIGMIAVIQSRTRSIVPLVMVCAAFAFSVADLFFFTGRAVWPFLVDTLRQGPNSPSWFLRMDVPNQTILLAVGWRASMAIAGIAACHYERIQEPA